tara:strand:+ start:898 stop:2142 length:1245 start_codon:yes stop_codon:yes gene_type:complete
MKNFTIGFVGLSHLGLNYLAASAEKKFNVIGIETDNKLLSKIKNFDIPYEEKNLKKILKKNKKRIFFSNKFHFLNTCNLVFVSKDVSTNKTGVPNLKEIVKLINSARKNINSQGSLVILSQLRPGFMRKINFNKKLLYYQVETLIFGKSLDRALNPERIIIGCNESNSKINNSYLKYLKRFNCPIIKMSYESAELTKIAINIFLASSITTTNVLSEICSTIGANWEEIKPALKLDSRIGPKAYLKPGLGISGGNIERDIMSLKKLSFKNLNLLNFANSLNHNSRYMKKWVLRKLKQEKIFNSRERISILGLSYKENTNSIKNSPSISLIKSLKNNNIKVFDPKAKLPLNLKRCQQVGKNDKSLLRSKILILMTPWKIFRNIKITKNVKLIIDPFKMINIKNIKNKKVKYYSLGV